MARLALLPAAVALVLAVAAPSGAQSQSLPQPAPGHAAALLEAPRERLRATARACRVDAARHCSEVAPGGGRVLACLEANRARIAPVCADRVTEMSAIRGAYLACYADQRRLCLDVTPGEGRVAACLKERRAQASPQCREALGQAERVLAR